MATTKMWTIKGNSNSKNSSKVSNSNSKSMYESLKYICEKNKDTPEFISGFNGMSSDYKIAYKQIRNNKISCKKTEGVQGYHFSQSFKPEEITPEKAHKLGQDLAKEMFGNNFRGIVSTHIDKGHIHNHFVIDSVGVLDNKKYVNDFKNYYKFGNISNELCKKNKLSIVKNNKIDILKYHIDDAILRSENFTDFENILKGKEIDVKQGENIKNITFKQKNAKGFRGKTLGDEYEKDAIISRINEKNIENLYEKHNLTVEDIEKDFEKINEINIEKSDKKGKNYTKNFNEKKREESYENVKKDIDAALYLSKNFFDFIGIMKSQGYSIKWGKNIKYISFKNKNMTSAVRGIRLGDNYNENRIKERIEEKKLNKFKDELGGFSDNAKWKTVYLNKKLLVENDNIGNKKIIKIPYKPITVTYDASDIIWKDDNTLEINICNEKNYTIYTKNNEKKYITGQELIDYYDESKNIGKTINEHNQKKKQENYLKNKEKKPQYKVKNKSDFVNYNQPFRRKKFKKGFFYTSFDKDLKISPKRNFFILLYLLKTKKNIINNKKMMPSEIKKYEVRAVENTIIQVNERINIIKKFEIKSSLDIENSLKIMNASKTECFKEKSKLQLDINNKEELYDNIMEYYRVKNSNSINKIKALEEKLVGFNLDQGSQLLQTAFSVKIDIENLKNKEVEFNLQVREINKNIENLVTLQESLDEYKNIKSILSFDNDNSLDQKNKYEETIKSRNMQIKKQDYSL